MNQDALSQLLNVEPHYTATELGWREKGNTASEISASERACLASICEGIGSVPISDITSTEALNSLVAKGFIVDCTQDVLRSRVKNLLAGKTEEKPKPVLF